jgi:hypothetical protein
MLNQSVNQKQGKAQKPAARIVAYRHYQDRDGNDKHHQVEVGAAWPTGNGSGFALNFKLVPAELLTGNCQLYIFPLEDKNGAK